MMLIECWPMKIKSRFVNQTIAYALLVEDLAAYLMMIVQKLWTLVAPLNGVDGIDGEAAEYIAARFTI